MKYAVLAVLLAVMQAAPPVPRKAANTSGAKNTKANQSQSDPRPTVSASAPQNQPKSQPPPCPDTKSATVVCESVPVPPAGADWWFRTYVIFTGALVAIGAVGIRYAIQTLNAIKRQAKANEDQLTEIQQSAEKTDRMILLAAQEAENGKIATAAAKKSADAAKSSADIAVGIHIPTLVIHEFTAGNVGASTLAAKLQFPKIDLVVKNYGQTPALLRSWSLIFTCEELPDTPDYEGQKQPGCGIVLTREVVKQNETYTLTAQHSWQRQELSLEDVEAIVARKKDLTAYGFVCYGDIFGNPVRRLKFCETALNMSDFGIEWRSELAPGAYVGTDQFPHNSDRR